jgi:mannose-6-phosphate isomerase-like protein (cupin superfamily)
MKYVRTVDMDGFKPAAFHSQIIGRPEDGIESAICILTRVPPGKGTSAGLHTHPADQIYYILKGEMNVQLGETKGSARAGQMVVIPQGLPHWNWNEGAQDELHFEFITPAPPPGVPLSNKSDDAAAGPSLGEFEFIRTLDESKFNPERFSSVVLADRSSGLNSTSIGVFRSPPGSKSPPLHVHRFEQIYFIISGTMTLQIGLEEYVAPPNSYVILPAGMPHSNWNSGDEVLWFINARTPEPRDRLEPWDRAVVIGDVEAAVP